jgi:predicted transcriptional regulator
LTAEHTECISSQNYLPKDDHVTQQKIEDDAFVELAAEIVSAYVAHNALSTGDLPKLITDVHQALKNLGAPIVVAEVVEELKPAVSVRKSVTPDFIICLDDGKQFKSLKRHIAQLGLTPNEYRAKWHLPKDYPMVAPNYSATRSQLAKSIGLGRKAAVPVLAAKARRGRKAAGVTA